MIITYDIQKNDIYKMNENVYIIDIKYQKYILIKQVCKEK